MAAVGLFLLAPLGKVGALDPVGLGFALGAGVCWALYILFGQKAGATNPTGAAALGMLVAAVVAFPVGFAQAGVGLFNPAILPLALVVAALSSALPYSLEMYALTRIPRATFGIMVSLEPAMASLAAWLILGQQLSARQGLAIALIVFASVAATLGLVSRSREKAAGV
jgi:inner membrane transporter RhtA